jgi:hypothetical protein
MSIFVASIAAQIVMVVTIFIGQKFFISHLPEVSVAVFFAVGTIVTIFVGFIAFKKIFRYLKNVIYPPPCPRQAQESGDTLPVVWPLWGKMGSDLFLQA